MKDEFNRIHRKLDKIYDKVEDIGARLSAAEESIVWLKGHVKISVTLTLAVIGWLANMYLTQ